MAITKEKKKEILEKIIEKVKKAVSVIFVGYHGIKIKDQEKLREILKKSNSEFLVVKKTLLNLALKDLKIENIENLKLENEVALALGYNDEIMLAKIISNFSKENENLKIKGGIFEKKIVDEKTIKFLSNLPSKNELKTQLLVTLQSPIAKLVNVFEANLRNLIYILDTLAKK